MMVKVEIEGNSPEVERLSLLLEQRGYEVVFRWSSGDYARATVSGRLCPSSPLTPRQLEVLLCLRDGLTYREVAERLGLSRQTLKNHIMAIKKRLGVSTTMGALARGLKEGWLV